MEIRQIQYFLSIVQTGSFTAAADHHHISQSSLSKRIIALEKELEVSLFDRSHRQVSLTSAGDVFLKHARQIDRAYKTSVVEIQEYKLAVESFSIGAIPVITQYGITTYIDQFKNTYPDISFTLEEIDGVNIYPALEEDRFDVAFARHNYLDHEKFHTIEILKDELIAVVSKKNRHAARSAISLEELSDDNFIVFDRVTDLYQLILDECDKAGFEPRVFYSSHSKVSVFGLVGANIGLALMPRKIVEYHQTPDVLAIPLTDHIACNLVLAYLKDKRLLRPVRTFIEFVEEACS